ncbi:hypothetical protein [Teredinibacter waterburyi]|jgi:hypothetical protein|uniref:hypothetical protein n=1 Tax=Teredinibacter waterburyi TaxID=1500538 RepID=UPI00165F393E|nr:hypothetical protein [Teredinibacter waterburyi]
MKSFWESRGKRPELTECIGKPFTFGDERELGVLRDTIYRLAIKTTLLETRVYLGYYTVDDVRQELHNLSLNGDVEQDEIMNRAVASLLPLLNALVHESPVLALDGVRKIHHVLDALDSYAAEIEHYGIASNKTLMAATKMAQSWLFKVS